MAVETNPYLDNQYNKHPFLCTIVYLTLSVLCIVVGIISWIWMLETWLSVMFYVGGVLGIACTVYLLVDYCKKHTKM